MLSIALAAQTIHLVGPSKASTNEDQQSAKNKLDAGNYSEALEIYNRLLKQGIKTAEVYYGRGRSLQELGNNEQALASYTKLIEIDPKNAIAYSNRGLVYGRLQKIKLALKDFDTAFLLLVLPLRLDSGFSYGLTFLLPFFLFKELNF